jgi:hypothetical protein
MEYNILGISIQCKVEINKIDTTDDNRQRYQIFVAWQSNLPGGSFSWRCTCGEKCGSLPNQEEIYAIASRGPDAGKSLAKKMFPLLPVTRLTH